MVSQSFIHTGSLADTEGVVAEADGHSPFLRLFHEPAEQVPPLLRKEFRLARHRETPDQAPGIAVGIVHLQPDDTFAFQLIELPQNAFPCQSISKPPVERNFTITVRRIPEARIELID